MIKVNKHMQAIHEAEAKYGRISDFPEEVLDEIRKLAPTDRTNSAMTEREENLIRRYLLKDGIDEDDLRKQIKRSNIWIKQYVKIVRKKMEDEKNGSKH